MRRVLEGGVRNKSRTKYKTDIHVSKKLWYYIANEWVNDMTQKKIDRMSRIEDTAPVLKLSDRPSYMYTS